MNPACPAWCNNGALDFDTPSLSLSRWYMSPMVQAGSTLLSLALSNVGAGVQESPGGHTGLH